MTFTIRICLKPAFDACKCRFLNISVYSHSIVPFAEGKLPSNWKNWLDPECKAKVVYGGIDGSKL